MLFVDLVKLLVICYSGAYSVQAGAAQLKILKHSKSFVLL